MARKHRRISGLRTRTAFALDTEKPSGTRRPKLITAITPAPYSFHAVSERFILVHISHPWRLHAFCATLASGVLVFTANLSPLQHNCRFYTEVSPIRSLGDTLRKSSAFLTRARAVSRSRGALRMRPYHDPAFLDANEIFFPLFASQVPSIVAKVHFRCTSLSNGLDQVLFQGTNTKSRKTAGVLVLPITNRLPKFSARAQIASAVAMLAAHLAHFSQAHAKWFSELLYIV